MSLWMDRGGEQTEAERNLALRSVAPAALAALCAVLTRVSITRYPTISRAPPTGSNSEPQTGLRSPIGSASLLLLRRGLLHARHLKCRIGRPS